MIDSVFGFLWDHRNLTVGGVWAVGAVLLSVLRFRKWFREDAEECSNLNPQDEEQMQKLMWGTFRRRRDERAKVLLTRVLFWPLYSVWGIGVGVAHNLFRPFLAVLDRVRRDAIEERRVNAGWDTLQKEKAEKASGESPMAVMGSAKWTHDDTRALLKGIAQAFSYEMEGRCPAGYVGDSLDAKYTIACETYPTSTARRSTLFHNLITAMNRRLETSEARHSRTITNSMVASIVDRARKLFELERSGRIGPGVASEEVLLSWNRAAGIGSDEPASPDSVVPNFHARLGALLDSYSTVPIPPKAPDIDRVGIGMTCSKCGGSVGLMDEHRCTT